MARRQPASPAATPARAPAPLVGGWKTLSAAVAGPRKQAAGGCEDHCAVKVLQARGAEVLVAVCADGAGSAQHGGAGARVACHTLLAEIEKLLAGPTPPTARKKSASVLGKTAIRRAFVHVAAALRAEAAQLGVAPRELATTLLLAVLGPDSAAFAQVGDGVIVIRDKDAYRHVFWPARGEYANTTDFATDEPLALRCTQLGAVDEVALMSDGLQVLALDYAAQAAHPPFFAGLFSEMHRAAAPDRDLAEPLHRFLGSPAVQQRTDDDVSLVLAVRDRVRS